MSQSIKFLQFHETKVLERTMRELAMQVKWHDEAVAALSLRSLHFLTGSGIPEIGTP